MNKRYIKAANPRQRVFLYRSECEPGIHILPLERQERNGFDCAPWFDSGLALRQLFGSELTLTFVQEAHELGMPSPRSSARKPLHKSGLWLNLKKQTTLRSVNWHRSNPLPFRRRRRDTSLWLFSLCHELCVFYLVQEFSVPPLELDPVGMASHPAGRGHVPI